MAVRVQFLIMIYMYHCSVLYSQCNANIRVEIEPITTPVRHGEGPYWSERENALYYVDVFQPAVLRWNFGSNEVTSCDIGGNSIGLIIPVKHRNNTFIVCSDRNVNLFTWDGKMNNSGSLQKLSSVDEDKPQNQFNDGKVDFNGNLWAGTLTRNQDLSVRNFGGTMYTFRAVNIKSPTAMLAPLSITNGIAWNKKNTKFFFIDSETRKIMTYEFDLGRPAIESPKLLFDLDEYPEYPGIPDGMTIDSNDNLWVAIYGGKAILQVNSETGKILDVIIMPVTYVSSVTFGGPNFSILFATSSRLKLTHNEISKEPLAGAVFAIHNSGARGLPPNEYRLYE